MITSNNIRFFREQHHLTQEELARLLHLTVAQLGRRERGEVSLRSEEISQLLVIFNCTYNELTGDLHYETK